MRQATWFLFLLSILILSACSANKSSKDSPEIECVDQFMQAMQTYAFTDSMLVKHLSPAFLKEKEVDVEKVRINSFDPEGYTIADQDGKEVYVLIWGEDFKWQHRLDFLVQEESGEYYIVPVLRDDGKLNPWQESELFITE